MGMTKHCHLFASAPVAIAAMTALPLTPAAAQEAPEIVLDTQPIVMPTTSPAPATSALVMQSSPTVQPVPATPVVEAAPEVTSVTAQQEDAAPTSTSRRSSPDAVTVTAAAPARTITTNVAEEPRLDGASTDAVEPMSAAAAVPVAESGPAPAPIEDNSQSALIMALLTAGAIGLAALLLVMARRKRRVKTPQIERPIVAREASATPPIIDREPVVTAYDEPGERVTPTETVYPAYETPASTNGAAVPLPAELPRSKAERRNLLQRMIAAKPDRANPFVSHKARAKRARLILQSIGTRFTDRKPGIDISQYANVWPELRGWRPAAA